MNPDHCDIYNSIATQFCQMVYSMIFKSKLKKNITEITVNEQFFFFLQFYPQKHILFIRNMRGLGHN